MRKEARIQGSLGLGGKSIVKFNLAIIVFEEDGATIAYCPALDLSGYGKNETEAVESYKYVMAEYFDYTTKKKTLVTDLKRLGWNVKNSLRKKIVPPQMSDLLKDNDNFKRVFENFDYKKLNTPVEIPAFA